MLRTILRLLLIWNALELDALEYNIERRGGDKVPLGAIVLASVTVEVVATNVVKVTSSVLVDVKPSVTVVVDVLNRRLAYSSALENNYWWR